MHHFVVQNPQANGEGGGTKQVSIDGHHKGQVARTYCFVLGFDMPSYSMKRMEANGKWLLFCPKEAPSLHEAYGAEFKACTRSMNAKAVLV